MILHQIITTEKVPFTYRVAGLGARYLAWLVDAGLMILLGLGGLMFGGVLDAFQPGLGAAVAGIWLFCVLFGYFLLFEWLWLGQTPGKRVVGIRVVQEGGTSVGFFQSAVRNLVRLVDALPAFYGLGVLAGIGHPQQRRLGDWAARTLVVHVERKGKPIRALHEIGAGPLSGEAVSLQRLAQLGREQKQTLLDLCLRRDQLRISDRAQLFRAVADYLQQELELLPGEHQSPEKFVTELVAAVLGSPEKAASR